MLKVRRNKEETIKIKALTRSSMGPWMNPRGKRNRKGFSKGRMEAARGPGRGPIRGKGELKVQSMFNPYLSLKKVSYCVKLFLTMFFW
jgi:hypothetical protein